MLTRVTITGMHAVHAVRAVQTALGALEGVRRIDVRLGEAEIEHDDQLTDEQLRAAIALAGFDVVGISAEPRRLPLA
jgi:copper chaperone CopZ